MPFTDGRENACRKIELIQLDFIKFCSFNAKTDENHFCFRLEYICSFMAENCSLNKYQINTVYCNLILPLCFDKINPK